MDFNKTSVESNNELAEIDNLSNEEIENNFIYLFKKYND